MCEQRQTHFTSLTFSACGVHDPPLDRTCLGCGRLTATNVRRVTKAERLEYGTLRNVYLLTR